MHHKDPLASSLEVKEVNPHPPAAAFVPKSEDFGASNTNSTDVGSDDNYYDMRYKQELPSDLKPYALLSSGASANYFYDLNKTYSSRHKKTWYELTLEEPKPNKIESHKLYLKKADDGTIHYTVKMANNKIVEDHPTEIDAPDFFTLNNVLELNDKIINAAKINEHIQFPYIMCAGIPCETDTVIKDSSHTQDDFWIEEGMIGLIEKTDGSRAFISSYGKQHRLKRGMKLLAIFDLNENINIHDGTAIIFVPPQQLVYIGEPDLGTMGENFKLLHPGLHVIYSLPSTCAVMPIVDPHGLNVKVRKTDQELRKAMAMQPQVSVHEWIADEGIRKEILSEEANASEPYNHRVMQIEKKHGITEKLERAALKYNEAILPWGPVPEAIFLMKSELLNPKSPLFISCPHTYSDPYQLYINKGVLPFVIDAFKIQHKKVPYNEIIAWAQSTPEVSIHFPGLSYLSSWEKQGKSHEILAWLVEQGGKCGNAITLNKLFTGDYDATQFIRKYKVKYTNYLDEYGRKEERTCVKFPPFLIDHICSLVKILGSKKKAAEIYRAEIAEIAKESEQIPEIKQELAKYDNETKQIQEKYLLQAIQQNKIHFNRYHLDLCRLLFVRVPRGNYAVACNLSGAVHIYGPGLNRVIDPSHEICYRGSYKEDKLIVSSKDMSTLDQMNADAIATIYFRILSPYDAITSFLGQGIQPSDITDSIKQYMQEELKNEVETIVLDNTEYELALRSELADIKDAQPKVIYISILEGTDLIYEMTGLDGKPKVGSIPLEFLPLDLRSEEQMLLDKNILPIILNNASNLKYTLNSEQYRTRQPSLTNHNNALRKRIGSRIEFRPNPSAGYNLLLVTQEIFDKSEKKATAMLIKGNDNTYKLYGWTEGEWQVRPLKNFDPAMIRGGWKDNEPISVIGGTPLFDALRQHHQQPFIEIIDVDIQLKPSKKAAAQLENVQSNAVLRSRKAELAAIEGQSRMLDKQILVQKAKVETVQQGAKQQLDKLQNEMTELEKKHKKQKKSLSKDTVAHQTYQTLKKERGVPAEEVESYLSKLSFMYRGNVASVQSSQNKTTTLEVKPF